MDSKDVQSFLKELEDLALECGERLGQVCSLKDLEEFRVEFLGRKGRLAQAMLALPGMSAQDKPAAGRKANEVKTALTKLIGERERELAAAEAGAGLSRFDPTQPVRLHTRQGSLPTWPLPPQSTQEMSTSALGSVKGKKLGRKRTLVFAPKMARTKAVSVPRRSAMLTLRSARSPSIWWNMGVWVRSESRR